MGQAVWDVAAFVAIAVSQLGAPTPPPAGNTPVTSVDWRNTTYQVDCASDGEPPVSVPLRNGVGNAPDPRDSGPDAGSYNLVFVTKAIGDLTGDGRPEAAVLLVCTPPHANYLLPEIQVFTEGPKLLDRIVVKPLPDSYYPGVNYNPDQFWIRDNRLVVGVDFYGPHDCHACGASIHRVLTWHWDGQKFVQT